MTTSACNQSNRHAIMICTYNFKVFWNNVHNWKSFQNISVLSTPLIFTSLSSNAVTFDNPKCGPDSQGSEVHMYVQVGNIANENGNCCCKAVFHLRILSTSYSSLCQSSAFQNNFGFNVRNNNNWQFLGFESIRWKWCNWSPCKLSTSM